MPTIGYEISIPDFDIDQTEANIKFSLADVSSNVILNQYKEIKSIINNTNKVPLLPDKIYYGENQWLISEHFLAVFFSDITKKKCFVYRVYDDEQKNKNTFYLEIFV